MHDLQIPKIGVLLCLVLQANYAEAYNFTPTGAEWDNWPGYCKAKYVWTVIGGRSMYKNKVSQSDRAELVPWENAGIYGIHHYCTGTIWLSRSRAEADPTRKKYLLNSAQVETEFTYRGSERHSPQSAMVAIQLATIYFEQGDIDSSIDVLEMATKDSPKSDIAYSALAYFLRKDGRSKEAIEVLRAGDKEVDGQSAEISYNLGLILLEVGEVDAALEHARKAYSLGYPLPGLRQKLRRLGRDPFIEDDQEQAQLNPIQ